MRITALLQQLVDKLAMAGDVEVVLKPDRTDLPLQPLRRVQVMENDGTHDLENTGAERAAFFVLID